MANGTHMVGVSGYQYNYSDFNTTLARKILRDEEHSQTPIVDGRP
jgi:hypothetical protein